MEYNRQEFEGLPDIINKEQMRIACHISKRTALYLLKSNLIPNVTSGKKTRCYRIKKSDVITYLEERENDPGKYLPPENWYKNYGTSISRLHTIRMLPSDRATKRELKTYYEDGLSSFPDVMDVDAIVGFTGYDRRTVGGWCRKGQLRFIMATPKYMIPKSFLIEFLCSDWYNKTIRKSKKHLNAIWDVQKNSHNRIPVQDDLE